MKKTLLTLIALFFCTFTFAQWGEEELPDKPTLKERIFTGGGFGLGFSSYSDFVSVSPLIGYRLTQRLAAGVSLQYQYSKYKQFSSPLTINAYGGGPFVRFNFYGPLFLHSEYEYLTYRYKILGEKFSKDFSSFLAGGGFFQPLGRNAGFYLLALYNFSYTTPQPNQISLYSSPWVLRAGITAGF